MRTSGLRWEPCPFLNHCCLQNPVPCRQPFQVGLEQAVRMLRTCRADNRVDSTDLETPSQGNVELMVVMKPVNHGRGNVWQCGLGQNAWLPGQVVLGKSQVSLWETFSVKKGRILFGNTSHMVLIRSVWYAGLWALEPESRAGCWSVCDLGMAFPSSGH